MVVRDPQIRKQVGRPAKASPLDQLAALNEFVRRIAPDAWLRDDDDEPIRKTVGRARHR